MPDRGHSCLQVQNYTYCIADKCYFDIKIFDKDFVLKFILRFILPLAVVLGLLTYSLLPLIDHLTTRWFVRDLDIRSKLIVNTIKDELALLRSSDGVDSRKKTISLLKKTTLDERLMALAICSRSEKPILKTDLFPDIITCNNLDRVEPHSGVTKNLTGGDIHLSYGYIDSKLESTVKNSRGQSTNIGPERLVLLHDMSFASRRSNDTKNYLFLIFLAIGVLISAITIVMARWSLAEWIKSVRKMVTGIRSTGSDLKNVAVNREFLPILKDLKGLIRDLEHSSKTRDDTHISWDPATLKKILLDELSGEEIIVVSNRQPYIHNRKGSKIEVQSPASGLVTAVEPILKACSGVWIAHGNGTADRDVVDINDRIKAPPGREQYEIHRVWLSKEEENGFYYGFANEGLWPLCHIAHTRPIFRRADWDQYAAVNTKFTEAIISNTKSDNPVVLVQDYHFALVPHLLRQKLPNAIIISFWHIPWPNPESFGICPWRQEILEGLLGSSIMGFHTQFHCNNFIDSVDRYLESRVDRETNSIYYRGKTTEIRPYPISIQWPPDSLSDVLKVDECRQMIQNAENITDTVKIGIGVDRLDYTKGIIERFRAVERLLELDPKWIGKFTFIQVAAPSRSSIGAYQDFDAEVRNVAQMINARFSDGIYKPIILKVEHESPKSVFSYFRAADICFVSSLHDGMNLVAKEFVASRDDEQGVLILSMFAGASRELAEALIVNPYDSDQSALAIKFALEMHPKEQKDRMRALRAIVKEFNVYRWAGRMLLDAAKVRQRNRFQYQMQKWTTENQQIDSDINQTLGNSIATASGMNGIGVFGL